MRVLIPILILAAFRCGVLQPSPRAADRVEADDVAAEWAMVCRWSRWLRSESIKFADADFSRRVERHYRDIARIQIRAERGQGGIRAHLPAMDRERIALIRCRSRLLLDGYQQQRVNEQDEEESDARTGVRRPLARRGEGASERA